MQTSSAHFPFAAAATAAAATRTTATLSEHSRQTSSRSRSTNTAVHLSPSIVNSWIVELDRWTTNLMLDQVLTGSLCFLALAIYMYIKFIRRDRSIAFEQVRPHAKEAQSPPSQESGTSPSDPFVVLHPHNNSPPPRKKPTKGHVYQHPMRRRTHSSMTNVDVTGGGGAPPLHSPTELVSMLTVEPPGPIPEDTEFFGRSPTILRKTISIDVDTSGSSQKKRPQASHLSSPDINLFAEVPSDKDTWRHLESQRLPDDRSFDVVLNMPSTSSRTSTHDHAATDHHLLAMPPPPLPPIIPAPPRAKLLLDNRQQPAQMQLEVARKAHIPLFLHLPLHPRKDDASAVPIPALLPPRHDVEGAPAVTMAPGVSHAIKRPSRSNSFNFRIDFHELAMGELIGQGAFGTVHKAIWRGTLVAVKILQVQHLSAEVLDEFETEVHIMSVYGKDWAALTTSIPSKTAAQIKNYYQNYKNRLGLQYNTSQQQSTAPTSMNAAQHRLIQLQKELSRIQMQQLPTTTSSSASTSAAAAASSSSSMGGGQAFPSATPGSQLKLLQYSLQQQVQMLQMQMYQQSVQDTHAIHQSYGGVPRLNQPSPYVVTDL
ncbi:hypothetical protein DYB36_000837 [Aphanomyces astaci]|uniref:Protein kinase domain-containing protein n=2 Tax=Aphanomyces astaci TaxID=112090 RepID=A0A397ASG9_APHAT|nr:hypothetical protein DYB36_000837 [Aphanomyces astaci]